MLLQVLAVPQSMHERDCSPGWQIRQHLIRLAPGTPCRGRRARRRRPRRRRTAGGGHGRQRPVRPGCGSVGCGRASWTGPGRTRPACWPALRGILDPQPPTTAGRPLQQAEAQEQIDFSTNRLRGHGNTLHIRRLRRLRRLGQARVQSKGLQAGRHHSSSCPRSASQFP